MGLLYKVIIFTNTILFIFSACVLGFSVATIYSFNADTEVFFTKGDFAWFIMASLIGIGISLMACVGARNPIGHYNLLFCYFFLISIALIMNAVGFYLYRVFVNNLETASTGDVTSEIRIESAREFNDFLLSAYIVCCTGCTTAQVAACAKDVPVARTSEGYCPTVGVQFDYETAPVFDCTIPELCSQEQRDKDSGLNQGCFINTQIIPPYEVFNNVCVFFDEFAETQDNTPIVGPVSEGSCGNGSPRIFVEDVFSFMSKNYVGIAGVWGFSVVIMLMAWLGSFYILLCPNRFRADTTALI